MFLARTIRRSKWHCETKITLEDVPADAITGDLRTQDNSLSFWHCKSSENDDIDDVVLAISAGRDSVQKVEVVWLERAELESSGQDLAKSDGNTPVTDLVDRHFDMLRLDYRRLGLLAMQMISAIASNQYRQLTRIQVRKLLVQAIVNGRLTVGDLSEKIQNEIQQSLDDI